MYCEDLDPDERNLLLNELSAYEEMRKHLMRLGVWPVDFGTLGRFAFSVFIAVLPVILTLLTT